MKFALCIVAVAMMATVDATPAYSDVSYFSDGGTLDNIQGAIIDVVSAAEDLGVMEGKLEAIVSASTDVFAVESNVEYAVDRAAYANNW